MGDNFLQDSVRSHGLHEGLWVFNDPASLKKPIEEASDKPANFDLTFTIDVRHVDDIEHLVRTALRYDDVQLVVTEPVPLARYHNKDVRNLTFREQDIRDTGIGALMSSDKPIMTLEAEVANIHGSKAADVGYLTQLTQRADQYGISFEVIRLIESHQALGLNYLVSDDRDIHKLRRIYFRENKHHLIYSSQLFEVIHRLERRRGIYYVGPGDMIKPKGFYYWRQLHDLVSSFDRTWAAAVYGVGEARLDNQYLEFVQSLSDRIMGLLQLRDDLELLREENPDNKAEWDMVNLLNYYFVLVTGLFDNLAWLAALKYDLAQKYLSKVQQISLEMPKSKARQPNKFQIDIQQANPHFYTLVCGYQSVMDVFYPIRHSIQHRLVLSGLILHHMDEDWERVVVRFAPGSINALIEQEAPMYLGFNSWGLFEAPNHQYLVEPSLFCKKATVSILQFVEEVLVSIDIPDLLTNFPSVLSRVNQVTPGLTRLMSTLK